MRDANRSLGIGSGCVNFFLISETQLTSRHLFQDKLISAVKHLHLTHLRLVFHYTVHRARQEAFIERRLRLADTCAAREADLLPTATRFINAIPTLQYVLLTTCGHTYQLPSPNTWESDQQRTLNKWLSSMAWRPVDSYDGHHRSNAKSHSGVVLLSRETAERIVEEEELYLSHDEDVSVPLSMQTIEADLGHAGHGTEVRRFHASEGLISSGASVLS